MTSAETLKEARNDLLKLHKLLLDDERFVYEKQHGLLSPTEFLQVLLEDTDFSWLRQFSILIVEIDEMFASKTGFTDELVDANIRKISDLLEIRTLNDQFRKKYSAALAANADVAEVSNRIKVTISGGRV